MRTTTRNAFAESSSGQYASQAQIIVLSTSPTAERRELTRENSQSYVPRDRPAL
jgi:hypothetical protein